MSRLHCGRHVKVFGICNVTVGPIGSITALVCVLLYPASSILIIPFNSQAIAILCTV